MKDRVHAVLIVCITLGLAGCGSQMNKQAVLSSSSGPASTAATTDSTVNPAVLSNLQTQAGNWQSFGQAGPDYVDCSAPCSESSWEQIFGVTDPSLSGNATMFDLDPRIPYADALFTAGVIGVNSPQIPDRTHTLLPSLHHFIYDTDFYVTNPGATQALEFDVSVWMSGIAGGTFGTECAHLGDGMWDIWNNATGHWESTGIPCEFVKGWNHFTLQVQRQADNSLLYESIALNGKTYTLNKVSASIMAPAGWWGINLNYQMDSNYLGTPNTTYLDNFSFSYW